MKSLICVFFDGRFYDVANGDQTTVPRKVLSGTLIFWDNEAGVMSYLSDLDIDADGASKSYHPDKDQGYDDSRNAGYPDGDFKNVLVCDAHGKPIIQDGASEAQPDAGYFISMTSYRWPEFKDADVRKYVAADIVPYAVIPSHVARLVKPKFLGCAVEVEDTKTAKIFKAVCADCAGNSIGEGSMKLADYFGLNPSPRTGGTKEKRFNYRFMAGQSAVINGITYPLQSL